MLLMLSKRIKITCISADPSLKYFSYFPQKVGFDITCKLSCNETICMKCQIPIFYFWEKEEKYHQVVVC